MSSSPSPKTKTKRRILVVDDEFEVDTFMIHKKHYQALNLTIYSLKNVRINNEDSDFALWIEKDYCSPALPLNGSRIY
jgi:hypothetical protein